MEGYIVHKVRWKKGRGFQEGVKIFLEYGVFPFSVLI
jgi:hypothetical protein